MPSNTRGDAVSLCYTAHVVEPKYPAAVDRYVDLGRFYDLHAAKAQAGEVKRHTHDYQDAYGRAYRCLKAARQVELDTVAEASRVFDRQRAVRRFSGIMARELRGRGSGTGKITRRFLGSLTYRGPVWRFDSVEALCPKVYELEDSYEQAGALLAALCGEATRRDYDVTACPSTEEPGQLEHLLIPELGVALCHLQAGNGVSGEAYRRVRLDALSHPENKARLRFRARMTGVLREEGIGRTARGQGSPRSAGGRLQPVCGF